MEQLKARNATGLAVALNTIDELFDMVCADFGYSIELINVVHMAYHLLNTDYRGKPSPPPTVSDILLLLKLGPTGDALKELYNQTAAHYDGATDFGVQLAIANGQRLWVPNITQ